MKKVKIESKDGLTKVYSPEGDQIPCATVRFIHTESLPKAVLELYDFEFEGEVSEKSVKYIKKQLTDDKDEESE